MTALRPARVLAASAVLVMLFAGCGDDNPASDSTTGSDESATDRSTAPDTSNTAEVTPTTEASGDDLFGVRYCEILAVTLDEVNTTAEVWGTQGLNDCPNAEFAAIDVAATAKDLGATIAIANGPRFWVLDAIVANDLAGSGEIREFNGIEMRSIALVDLGPGIPNRTPYTERSVSRDTEFIFDAGREIYELHAADGRVFVMQSYSIETDASLTADTLDKLGDSLALPEGWTFSSRVLDEALVVRDVDGVATVVQDEFNNTYQFVA